MKVLNGPKYKQGWKLMLKNCGHSMKWKELAVNRTLLVMIKRQANTFFMIVQRKVLKAAEVFATTVKRCYGTVIVYHNGAESYYAARAFRGSLRV